MQATSNEQQDLLNISVIGLGDDQADVGRGHQIFTDGKSYPVPVGLNNFKIHPVREGRGWKERQRPGTWIGEEDRSDKRGREPENDPGMGAGGGHKRRKGRFAVNHCT